MGNGNPSSTRLTPSAKPTRPGFLRHSNIQQAATGPHSDPASVGKISSRCTVTHRARAVVNTSSDGGRRGRNYCRTSPGLCRKGRGSKRGNCDRGLGSNRGSSWDVDPPVALPASSGNRCTLSSCSCRTRRPHVGIRPGTHSFPTWEGTAARGDRGGLQGAGDPFPWGNPPWNRFPLWSLPLCARFFWGAGPLGPFSEQTAGQKAGPKIIPFLKRIPPQKAGQKAGEFSWEKAGEVAGGHCPRPRNTGA